MEGRFEQLVVLVVVLSLFDLLVRWAKRRSQQQRAGEPEKDEGELAFGDEGVVEIEAIETEEEVVLEPGTPWDAPASSPPLPPLPSQPPLPSPTAPLAERLPARAAPSGAPVRTSTSPAAEHTPRRRRRALGPGEARRGMVLMTVLGPCRALDMDRR